jgi:hypothetical protein
MTLKLTSASGPGLGSIKEGTIVSLTNNGREIRLYPWIDEKPAKLPIVLHEPAVRFHMEDSETEIQIDAFVQAAGGDYRIARIWLK